MHRKENGVQVKSKTSNHVMRRTGNLGDQTGCLRSACCAAQLVSRARTDTRRPGMPGRFHVPDSQTILMQIARDISLIISGFKGQNYFPG
jgi:hypothetical protein